MLSLIHECIPLCEWLAHMSLFHANAQMRNESARTLYITLVSEEEEEEDETRAVVVVAVSPHALEPGYSHLYSIPQQQQQHCAAARITLAFSRDSNGAGGGGAAAAVHLLLRSGDRLRVSSL